MLCCFEVVCVFLSSAAVWRAQADGVFDSKQQPEFTERGQAETRRLYQATLTQSQAPTWRQLLIHMIVFVLGLAHIC